MKLIKVQYLEKEVAFSIQSCFVAGYNIKKGTFKVIDKKYYKNYHEVQEKEINNLEETNRYLNYGWVYSENDIVGMKRHLLEKIINLRKERINQCNNESNECSNEIKKITVLLNGMEENE